MNRQKKYRLVMKIEIWIEFIYFLTFKWKRKIKVVEYKFDVNISYQFLV